MHRLCIATDAAKARTCMARVWGTDILCVCAHRAQVRCQAASAADAWWGRARAQGMAYLHAKSIVHFDLKSANLLLGYRDRRAICKVADFGLSKQKRDTYVSNVTSQRGTLPWIAPEIIKTPNAVTERVRATAVHARTKLFLLCGIFSACVGCFCAVCLCCESALAIR